MPDISSLTAKEKESLYLLLEGHDAKSAAVALGISVHTFNERLRAARRKLSVTSSKEAARLLGSAESEKPKNLVPKDLRGDTRSQRAHHAIVPTVGPAAHSVRWQNIGVIGGLTMFFILSALIAMMPPVPDEATSERAQAEEEAVAAQALAQEAEAQAAQIEQQAAEVERSAQAVLEQNQALLDNERFAELERQAARFEQQAAELDRQAVRLEEKAIELEQATTERIRND